MAAKHEPNPQVRLTTLLLIAALLFALIFGITVLAAGDWIPGTLIVVASAIGLARLVPTIHWLKR